MFTYMKTRVTDVRQIWMGCILLSTALSSPAASLGRHSGAGVIGQPLDIRAQVLLGAGEAIEGLCVSADVFYGDSQVSAAAVRTTIQKTTPDAEASIRIQSSVPVNEPVVTVYVRAGCNAPFSRRYVLLADPITEPAGPVGQPVGGSLSVAPPMASNLPTVPSLGAQVPAASDVTARGSRTEQPDAVATTGPSGSPQSGQSPGAKPARAQGLPGNARPPSVVKRPVPLAAARAPRLELDAVDLSLNIERDPILKLTLSLLGEPTTSAETRAAAAALWKAINASPEDVLRDSQKLLVLEAEAKAMREAESRNKAAMDELTARLEQSRYLNWLVYLLGAFLLLALAGLLLLWRRRQQAVKADLSRSWWTSEGSEQAERTGVVPNSPDALGVDIDFNLDEDSSLDSLRPLSVSQKLDASASGLNHGNPSIAVKDKREFAPSLIGASRSVAAEELFDVQQQADFFISLGEDEQAIQVLRNHIGESQEPSALAYLDLFRLYHKLDRRADYEKLRVEFNHVFNAGAPPFDQYTDQSRGLDSYETAFSRIQSLWPDPRVLDVIEQSIFRHTGEGEADAEVFDLEAYRELLLLHAVAKDIITRDMAGTQPPKDFQSTAMQPLKVAGKTPGVPAGIPADALMRETLPLDAMPPASPRLGLDVDLDELAEFSAFEASLPEVLVPVEPTAQPNPPPGDASRGGRGNLIDFEVLDFMTPDELSPPSQPTGKT